MNVKTVPLVGARLMLLAAIVLTVTHRSSPVPDVLISNWIEEEKLRAAGENCIEITATGIGRHWRMRRWEVGKAHGWVCDSRDTPPGIDENSVGMLYPLRPTDIVP